MEKISATLWITLVVLHWITLVQFAGQIPCVTMVIAVCATTSFTALVAYKLRRIF